MSIFRSSAASVSQGQTVITCTDNVDFSSLTQDSMVVIQGNKFLIASGGTAPIGGTSTIILDEAYPATFPNVSNVDVAVVVGYASVIAAVESAKLVSNNLTTTKAALQAIIDAQGNAATKTVVTGPTDTTTDRVLTVGYGGINQEKTMTDSGGQSKRVYWGADGWRNGYIQSKTKEFSFSLDGITKVLYIGTFREGMHTITLSNKGNSGYNQVKAEYTVEFNSTGTNNVDPHAGSTIQSLIISKDMGEFQGFHTIKVNSDEAALYLEYVPTNNAGQTGQLAVSVLSTSYTIEDAYNPYETEVWTPLTVTQMQAGTHKVSEQFEINSNLNKLLYKGFNVYSGYNTNFSNFACPVVDDYLAQGVARTASLAVFSFPLQSLSAPSSITLGGGGFDVIDGANTVLASNVTANITLVGNSSPKLGIVHISGLSGLTPNTPLFLRGVGSTSSITFNF